MNKTEAKFITLEGMEGAGKSTNLKFVCEWFEVQGIEYHVTREPGGTPVAEKVRELLLADHSEPINPLAELLLMFAARAQHIESVIKPMLEKGIWVLSDRFTDATYAYQGAGRQLGVEKVELLEQFVQKGLRPDLTIILDIPVDVSVERITRRGDLDRFEKEDRPFFERVREAYLMRAQSVPDRYRLIDATRSLPEVKQALEVVLNEL